MMAHTSIPSWLLLTNVTARNGGFLVITIDNT